MGERLRELWDVLVLLLLVTDGQFVEEIWRDETVLNVLNVLTVLMGRYVKVMVRVGRFIIPSTAIVLRPKAHRLREVEINRRGTLFRPQEPVDLSSPP